jgi:hypothetical protein
VPPSVFTTGTCAVPPSVFTTGTRSVLPGAFTTGAGAVSLLQKLLAVRRMRPRTDLSGPGGALEWRTNPAFPVGTMAGTLIKAVDCVSAINPRRRLPGWRFRPLTPKFSKTSTPRPWMSLATPACTGVEPAEQAYQYRTPRVDRRAAVKEIGLPAGSLHTTTNARRYVVAAGVARTATGIRWMQSASPTAPLLQLAAARSQDRLP